MNNNRTTRLGILVLALTIISIIIISGTYAKYTSSAIGTDTATVAKWSIKLNNNEIATGSEETVAIDLFSTIKDSDGSSTETDVTGTKKIAPGTSGAFGITIANESEVTAEYELTSTLTKTDNTLPIEFSTDNGSTWASTLSISSSNATTIAAGASDTINVKWRWAFNGDDTVDTALGIKARGEDNVTVPSVTVNVSVTATQVD